MKRYKSTRFVAVALAALALGACADRTPATPTDTGAPRAAPESGPALADRIAREELALAAQGRNLRGIESEILRLEGRVPGFGGMYFDPDAGRMVAFVTDEARGEAAAAAIRAYLQQVRHGAPEAERSARAQVEVRRGEYPFSELVAWSRVLLPDLASTPGWLAIDADERINRVRVTVAGPAARAAVEELAARRGLPPGALRVEEGSMLHVMSGRASAPTAFSSHTVRDRHRTTGAGIEIRNAHGGTCSHGWTVAEPGGAWGYLTAAHCTIHTPGDGSTGETFFQVNQWDWNDALGTVSRNPAWNLACAAPGGGQFAGRCTDADAMFVAVSPLLTAKKVARTPAASYNQVGSLVLEGWFDLIDNPGPLVEPAVGYVAVKRGRTTGSTRGVVAGSCEAHVICDLQDGAGNCIRTYLATCQGRVVNSAVGPGDSGGPVSSLRAQPVNGPPTPQMPWGISIAGTLPAPGAEACVQNCTLLFTKVSRIRDRLGQNYDFGT